MSFKQNFLWGTSISAAQSEGAWNIGGKSPILLDYATSGNPTTNSRTIHFIDENGNRSQMPMMVSTKIPKGAKLEIFNDLYYANHNASDFYHHYKEDITLMSEMGFSTFNTSISWARIFPYGIEGGINQEGVEFYRNVFTECKKHNINPIITLYKYDEPVYFMEKYGGWTNKEMINQFVEFARVCFTEYKGLVTKWVTFNEINMLLANTITGHLETEEEPNQKYIEVHNQMIAAAKVVKLGHEIDGNNLVGCMICGLCNYPLTSDPYDVMETYKRFQDEFCYCADTMMRGSYPGFVKRIWKENNVDLKITEEEKVILKEGIADFLAFSYYMSFCVTTHEDAESSQGNIFQGVKNPYLEFPSWGWSIDSIGFRYFLNFLYDRYQKPLFVIENGLGAYDKEEDGKIHDPYRIDYLRSHISEMKKAVEEGVDVMGYTTWGGFDLVSASTGQMAKRYGLVYIDMNDEGNGDFHRSKKDSFYWYKKVIKSNGEDLK